MDKKMQKIILDIYNMNNDDLNLVVRAVKLRRNQLHTSDAQWEEEEKEE